MKKKEKQRREANHFLDPVSQEERLSIDPRIVEILLRLEFYAGFKENNGLNCSVST